MAERITELFGYRLRDAQQEIMAYQGGKLAVSAVPGSGKTLTLALLAAQLIVDGKIGDQGEVLVVTVQNSAVTNISARIRQILESEHLPPVGFRVCTLHRLAADILRRRYDLAGMEEILLIVDDGEAGRLIDRAIDTWLATHSAWWESFLGENAGKSSVVQAWRRETEKIAHEVIKECKHLRLHPSEARQMLGSRGAQESPFLLMGIEIYELYARYLQTRGGLDFDDLIWRAIEALKQDSSFLTSLREAWPYILEDEAQDSSPLQENILAALAGAEGNWVRVGDPNQSINSTFTAADPRYFRRFAERSDVASLTLPQTGRCAQPIMDLANNLVDWTTASHPDAVIRSMAFQHQHMLPTDAGDPQPNPSANDAKISIRPEPFETEQQETTWVATWAGKYVSMHPERTCAILCPTQISGSNYVQQLQNATPPVPCEDLLRSTPQTRAISAVLADILRFLERRAISREAGRLFTRLAKGNRLACGGQHIDTSELSPDIVRHVDTVLSSIPTENLLFPMGYATLEDLLPSGLTLADDELALVNLYVRGVRRWVRASSLPTEDLVLTIAQDIFDTETELAIVHVVASSLSSMAMLHPEWHIGDLAHELDLIARNRRALGSLSLADSGYIAKPGAVVVTTMHKAKGLEWDLVFVTGLNSLDFPTALDDRFRDEPFFMPGRAPAIEARKELEMLVGTDFAPQAGADLVIESHREYICERLRLLYVALTRARSNLIITCSRSLGERQRPVQPSRLYTLLLEFTQGSMP